MKSGYFTTMWKAKDRGAGEPNKQGNIIYVEI